MAPHHGAWIIKAIPWAVDAQGSELFEEAHAVLGKVNRPTMFFYLAVATSTAKISLGRNGCIFMKRETLQKRHKQSNKHVFRVCQNGELANARQDFRPRDEERGEHFCLMPYQHISE